MYEQLKIKLKPYAGSYFGFDLEIQVLENKIKSLTEANSEKDLQLKTILDSDLTKTEKINSLQLILDTLEKEKEFENYITNKIPKADRYYSRTEIDGEYSVDVRIFFMINDKKIPIVTGATNDDKALAGLKLVKSLTTYVPDSSTATYKQEEYWAYPYQTLKKKMGDCEDGGILLANILVRSGVPWYRVRVCAGSVKGGGHAYCVYCRETDNEWVVLDWCYWYNTLSVAQRPTHKQMQNYFDKDLNFYVWFSWDLKNTYAKEELTSVAQEIFSSKLK